MLYADKRALETNLKVSLLQIREKELNFYTQNCLAVGTQAALLAGFAYAGLTQVSVPPEAPYVVKLLYLLFTTAAMSCELIAVLNTTLLSMLGPGLALRGPDGSMHQAVDGMMLEYRRAFFTFGLGLLAFHMSALMFGWLMFRPRECAAARLARPVCELAFIVCLRAPYLAPFAAAFAREGGPLLGALCERAGACCYGRPTPVRLRRHTTPLARPCPHSKMRPPHAWLLGTPAASSRAVVAVSMTVCILVALRVLWRYVVRIFAKFQLPKDMVVSGRFAQEAHEGSEAGVDPHTDARVIGRCARRGVRRASSQRDPVPPGMEWRGGPEQSSGSLAHLRAHAWFCRAPLRLARAASFSASSKQRP